jgi:Arm domain-containing DNA-binding protein/integrase-like protein
VPTKKLTDLFVERVKPPARGRVEYFDASFGGLALRVTESGHKSWSLHYRFGGRLRRLTIGDARSIKPAQARREAAAALERVRQGVDPSVEKRLRRLAPDPGKDTVAVLVDDYLKRYALPNTAAGTYKETKRTFERDVLPDWGNLPLSAVTPAHAISLIDHIAADGARVQANRTLARLRHLFNWAVERGRLSASPVAAMKPPTKERARDRTLSDDEVRWFWSACEMIGWPFGPLAKLLLLTAQRRDEVGGIEWTEIHLEKRRGPSRATGQKTTARTRCISRLPRSKSCSLSPGSTAGQCSARTAGQCQASRKVRLGWTQPCSRPSVMNSAIEPKRSPIGSCMICAARPQPAWRA